MLISQAKMIAVNSNNYSTLDPFGINNSLLYISLIINIDTVTSSVWR